MKLGDRHQLEGGISLIWGPTHMVGACPFCGTPTTKQELGFFRSADSWSVHHVTFCSECRVMLDNSMSFLAVDQVMHLAEIVMDPGPVTTA